MIKSAAILFNNKIYTGNNHSDIIYNTTFKEGIDISNGIKGFIDNYNNFHDRQEAGKIALECCQIKKLSSPPNLYSYDLKN
jgi:hypothetical protein